MRRYCPGIHCSSSPSLPLLSFNSGESGAGKTESCKLLVAHLIELSRAKSVLEQRILQVRGPPAWLSMSNPSPHILQSHTHTSHTSSSYPPIRSIHFWKLLGTPRPLWMTTQAGLGSIFNWSSKVAMVSTNSTFHIMTITTCTCTNTLAHIHHTYMHTCTH